MTLEGTLCKIMNFFLKFGVFWCGSGGAMLGYLLCALMRNDILNSYSEKDTT